VWLLEKDYISSPLKRIMVSFLSPIVRGKELRSEKTNFYATQVVYQISTLYILLRNIYPIVEGCL